MASINLNEKEEELANKFIKEHKKCVENNPITSGGHFNYIITPTGLGGIVQIQCSICKKTKNITDFDSW